MNAPSSDRAGVAGLLRDRGVTLVSLDLDDTLLDTDGAAEERVGAAVAEARRVLPRLDPQVAELALREAMLANPVTQGRMSAFMAALEIDSTSAEGVAIRAAYNRVLLDALDWIEGAREVVLQLRERFTLAIVTNGPSELQWGKVRKFRVDSLVDHVIVSGDVGHHKPDPAIFRHLLEVAGREATAAAHVGDSIHSDIAGACAAGMTAIWYPPHKRQRDDIGEHRPDAVIERLEDLLD